ncbi:galactose mutarotase-like [Schistocerca piceifrons]|uniref:galactose mutarotase-like n=1 Tax=Schistocerca piceifrons TaxID=274613 RepID=UPI001F5E9E34|nr:galactose mutarotase-like [Schistocerca piceifrons]
MLEDGVLLSHVSGDGAGGFPGAVLTEVSYRLPRDSVLPELWVDMTAVATAPTPLDMSLALPFNLAGHDAGEPALKDHLLTLDADQYLATTRDFIPTGQLWYVGGTCLDFRKPVWLGLAMERPSIGGLEHTFCLTPMPPQERPRFVARLEHPMSGRAVEVRSDHCAARVYSFWDLSPPWVMDQGAGTGDDVGRTEPAPEGHFYKENRASADELFPDYVDLYAGPEEEEEGAGDAAEAGEQPECLEEGERPPTQKSDVSCHVSATTLPGLAGKGGSSYYKNGAIMITPQGYPNAVNKVTRTLPLSVLKLLLLFSHPGE